MRRILFAPLIFGFLLAACQMAGPGAGPAGGPVGIAGEAIAVTPLAAPGAGPVEVADDAPPVAAVANPGPDDAPADVPEVAAEEEAEPEAPKTAEQMLCEKSGGQWASAGESGAFYCASLTRDGGKQCRRKTQCEGQCLARSGTCAPIMPLYGCNDILEKDGRQVTLCIN